MTAPAGLVRAGWKNNTIKPGDKVKVTLRPMVDGTPGGLFVSITLPTGQQLIQQAPKARSSTGHAVNRKTDGEGEGPPSPRLTVCNLPGQRRPQRDTIHFGTFHVDRSRSAARP